MIIRDAPSYNLQDLSEKLEQHQVQVVETTNDQIRVDIPNYQVSIEDTDIPLTGAGIKALALWVDVPYKFVERVEPDMQQYILSTLLERNPGEARVSFSDYGLEMVRSPQTKFIDPRSLVEVATRVIDPSAPVVDFWSNSDEFRLDVIVPEGFDKGIGGDRQVGDLTRGGIRIGQNQRVNQTNISPWVSEYLYRLVCTNGMEVMDEGLKVDARGNSVEEVLAEFEALADRAFSRVENTIDSFYKLREQRLENPALTLRQLAREQGIPARVIGELLEEIALTPDEPSMFDIINLITNYANGVTRTSTRRRLELAGGSVVREHVERCSVCQSRIN